MSLPGTVILPMTYLGPVEVYVHYLANNEIIIEQCDSYEKQSFRNRCEIHGANGKLDLIIPIKHVRGEKLSVKDARIDYDTDWRRLHWKGIESAYSSSPFFEYYRDIFEPYYDREYIFLKDLCLDLNEDILKILNINNKPKLSESFVKKGNTLYTHDLREKIHPKQADFRLHLTNAGGYFQVFSNSHGFISNLSIIDLIFNTGPEAIKYLSKCCNLLYFS